MYLIQQGEPLGSASHSGAGQACSPQRLWRLWAGGCELISEQTSHHSVVCDCGVVAEPHFVVSRLALRWAAKQPH